MGQQPTPRGVAGGAKAPNIFQCWWLFGPWQAAVSSRPAGQQANRPAGKKEERKKEERRRRKKKEEERKKKERRRKKERKKEEEEEEDRKVL